MSIAINVTNALTAANAYNEAVVALRKDFKGKATDAVRTGLLPHVAAFYAVPVVDGAGKATGTKVLDKDATKYEAAKKALQRLTKDIVGATDGKAEEVEIPAELLAAAAKLAKLAAQYEGARSLASKALAQAFAA